jgi:hypothetical protein
MAELVTRLTSAYMIEMRLTVVSLVLMVRNRRPEAK